MADYKPSGCLVHYWKIYKWNVDMEDKDFDFLLGVVLLAPVIPYWINVFAGSLYLVSYLFLSCFKD